MKVTDSERLILLMLSEIYDSNNVQGEIDPDFIRSALFSDKMWSVSWKYPGIPFEEAETPPLVKEVLNILDMWSMIEFSYGDLSEKEQEFVRKEAAPFGDNPKFDGFDGNNETDYMSTASFIVNQLDRFLEFSGRDFNSHIPSVDTYNRMLTKYKSINKRPLNKDSIVQILKARIHPSNR